jgi:hypothetical protein
MPSRILSLLVVVLSLSLLASPSLAHVEEPDTIDLVSNNKEKTEVFLGVVQQLPWNPRTFGLLRRKLATYESFALQGELHRRYPHTAGMQITIEVAYFIEPEAVAIAELQQLASGLASKGIKLRWYKLQRER